MDIFLGFLGSVTSSNSKLAQNVSSSLKYPTANQVPQNLFLMPGYWRNSSQSLEFLQEIMGSVKCCSSVNCFGSVLLCVRV